LGDGRRSAWSVRERPAATSSTFLDHQNGRGTWPMLAHHRSGWPAWRSVSAPGFRHISACPGCGTLVTSGHVVEDGKAAQGRFLFHAPRHAMGLTLHRLRRHSDRSSTKIAPLFFSFRPRICCAYDLVPHIDGAGRIFSSACAPRSRWRALTAAQNPRGWQIHFPWMSVTQVCTTSFSKLHGRCGPVHTAVQYRTMPVPAPVSGSRNEHRSCVQ